MKIDHVRIFNGKDYCISHIYVNGTYVCDAVEDLDRGLDQKMPLAEIKIRKVYRMTAIPVGTYTGTNAEDRTVAAGSANFVAVDTMHNLLKVVKLGHTTNRYLTPINYICYDYINKKIINEG